MLHNISIDHQLAKSSDMNRATKTPSAGGGTTISDRDVIKGLGVQRLKGNVDYHKAVEAHRVLYATCATNKVKIAEGIVKALHTRGGRFLKFDERTGFHSELENAGKQGAVEMTSQALRKKKGILGSQIRACESSRGDIPKTQFSDAEFYQYSLHVFASIHGERSDLSELPAPVKAMVEISNLEAGFSARPKADAAPHAPVSSRCAMILATKRDQIRKLRMRPLYNDGRPFKKQNVEEIFGQITVAGSRFMAFLDDVWTDSFKQYAEQFGLSGVTLEPVPTLIHTEMFQKFIVEGNKCCAQSCESEVRLAFHGTAEWNIQPILRDGLNPSLRRGQSYGQGEYFGTNPSLSLGYCRGGHKMIVFAIITLDSDIKGPAQNIAVVNKGERQLPVAVLSFESCTLGAMGRSYTFQQQVTNLLNDAKRKTEVARRAWSKEKMIHLILQQKYVAGTVNLAILLRRASIGRFRVVFEPTAASAVATAASIGFGDWAFTLIRQPTGRRTAEASISRPGTALQFHSGGATLVSSRFCSGSASFGLHFIPHRGLAIDVLALQRRRTAEASISGIETARHLVLAGLRWFRVDFAAVTLAWAAFQTPPRLGNQ
ncbi:hypothetical protein THAOC_34200 [Thalassiosira oceanica]|uniref:Uncharacterized protein n=1 Tax=Thalassiosira oceanica TaxID=159749 RepID=K0R5I5_THAOC|nr:hypothetical protein THAOC_34200 [Thalassiosira oceanica]|eukprot:EJK47104.1 hypothetical protein THAOC_34200 [Thalassiosira oceanica]